MKIGRYGFNNITYEEACLIEDHSNVKEISIMYNMGDYQNLNGEDIYNDYYIIGCDTNAINNLVKNHLVDGKLPENSNEVVININNSSDNIGDTLTQTLKNGEIKEYTVVGKVALYNNFFDWNDTITLLNREELDPESRINITILNYNVKQIYSDYYDIYYKLDSYMDGKGGSKLDSMVMYNKTLLEYENVFEYTSDFQKNIYTIEGIFIGIIVICSIIFIYSIINISIIERKKYFGILKSVGATTKQMRRSVRAELFIILLIAMPLGILISIGIDFLLITIINNMLPEITASYTSIFSILDANEQFNLFIPISNIALVIIIIIATVYIASMIPITKISWFQPINLIKQNKEKNKIKLKKHKKFKETKNIEAKLAWKNIERYKARYSAIIASLTISIALIIVSNYYISNIMLDAENTDYNYSITINYEKDKHGDLSEKIIDDIQESGIAEKVIYNSQFNGYNVLVDKENISDEEKEVSKKIYGDNYDLMVHFDLIFASDDFDYNNVLDIYNIDIPIPILTLNEDAYNRYLNEIGIDKLEGNECILVDSIHEKTKYYDNIRLTNYKEGDELTLKLGGVYRYSTVEELQEDNVKLKIKKITDKIPKDLSYIERGPIIVGTEETILSLDKQYYGEDMQITDQENKTLFLKVNNVDSANDFIKFLKEKYNLSDYDITNFNDPSNFNSISGSEIVSKDSIDSANLLRNTFIYSFIGIVTFVGILNMYNAINTNLNVRKKEIVTLITLGMEEKQINKMLFIENTISGLLAFVLSSIIGILASYLIYFNTIDYLWYSFEIPWLAIGFSAICITLIIILSTIYLKKKLFTYNYIEIIKNEEV